MEKDALIYPTIILAVTSIYYFLINRQLLVNRHTILVTVLSTIFFVFYIININTEIDIKIDYLVYLAITFLLFLFISISKSSLFIYPLWTIFVFLFSNILFLPRLLSVGEFTNANSTGIIAFLLLFFCFITIKDSNYLLKTINIYTILMLIVVLFTATSRTAQLAFIIVLITYLILFKLNKYVFVMVTLLIVFSISFVFFYTLSNETPVGNKLTELSREYTGKNFYSGRDRIWNDAFEEVTNSNDTLTGLGNNIQYEAFSGYLHNLYVQLFYQAGIIGLALMVSLLLVITYIAQKASYQTNDHYFKILTSFFIAILVMQIFEGHLIYKFSIISILCWVIISLFVNKSLKLIVENGN
ncbi:O-antigen ligase family protein [Virgibacillus byunsanensis]